MNLRATDRTPSNPVADKGLQPIGVGLIGFGLGGRVFHAPLLAACPRLELRAIVTRRADEVAHRYPGVTQVTDIQRLFGDPLIELVVISTPPSTHAGFAEMALQAGRHVVVDKPFTITVAEADRLIELATSTGRLLSIYQNRRWDDDFRTVAEAVADGTLGTVRRYIARFESLWNDATDDHRRDGGPGVGALYDVGSHLIDQAIVLFGPPRSVTARLWPSPSVGPDRDFLIALEMDGFDAVLIGSNRTILPGPSFEVHGDRASLVVEARDSQERLLLEGKAPSTHEPAPPARLATSREGRLVETELGRPITSWLDYYENVAMAIREDLRPAVTADAARLTVRVIEAVRQSAEEWKTVRIGE